MECENKIKFALAVVSLGAISLLLTAQYRRRRKLKCPPSSCYLQSDHSKPQLSFKRVLADNSFSQFKHQKLGVTDSGNDSCLNSHPYEAEIAALIENPAVELRTNRSIDLEMSGSYVWVETESQLRDLADVLSKESVFAVDTEQHSLRSFQGFTALIQISTGMEDYLVDAIALHDRMSILGPVFANPSICKVFHGADNDVLWLQRDFHKYVVNLFDTAKACEVLSKPQKSLAYLLEAYCGVATNKSLQREDWRQRPLSAEMLQYARTDAHYLLYVAGCLIAELKPQDNDNSSCPDDKFRFVAEASRRSHMICLQLYAKEIEVFPGESAASSIISRHLNGQGGSSMLSDTQDLVRRLCMWRELMARVHDESLRYVLSDQAIVSLSVKVPTSQVEIYDTVAQADLNMDPLNSISSLSSPSPVVCSHMDNLHHLIHDKESDLNDIFSVLLQKCLGPNGSCPMSVYNYALLVNNGPRITNKLIPTQNGNQRQIARKASRELFVQKFSCKAPVYHNCRIYANDGRLLCYCDRRKLEWYLRRSLAKLVDDKLPAIMLLFEPKGRPEDEDNDFYIQSKKNICVGCGEGSHYLRYRIIPSCYRMHFPEHLKSHRSHDIVLLCVDCHEIAHAAAEKYKRQIAADFGVPLFVRKVVDSNEAPIITEPSSSVTNAEETGVSPLQLRTAAMALLRHGQRMPPQRRNELKQVVMQYYGGREISEEDLERALLVGMSPHERRRLQKKRGLAFKHSTGRSIFLDGKPVNVSHTVAESAAEDTSAVDLNSSNATVAIANCRKNDEDYITATDSGLCDPCTDIEMNGIICATARKSKSDACEVSDTQDLYAGKTDDKYEKSPLHGLPDLSHDRHDVSISSKSNLSLLGHGPHGKQVVAHILREYGEDGIGQFCQRWRQVFVEAINPRFLPAGWNVMHSGRREFGEFSVYNPAKRTFGAKIELMHSVTGMDSLDYVT